MLAIVALEVPLATSVADRVDAEVRQQASAQADLAAATVADLLGPDEREDREELVETVAATARGRVIVVDARGRLIADSEGGAVVRDYAGRPEIAAALEGRRDQRERESRALGVQLLATAVPVLEDGRTVGAVRITQNVDAVDRAVRRSWIGLALIGVVVLGLGLLVGSLIAGGITRPLRRLDGAARRVAEGDLTARAPVEGSAEQRSLSRTFNDMTARLERLVAAQRVFVADASHQLRTPLTGLRLRLEAAQGGALDDQAKDDVGAALTEVDRLAQMVAELLELSRAGERDARGERLSLGDVACGAAVRWQATAQEAGLRVSGDVAADDGAPAWIAEADADRIVDVLVENALRYAPAGTEVEVVALPGGVEVRDRGPGLTGDDADRVFERFHRGSAGRSGPAGTGLGLPIARELARRWGGDVELLPRDGGGTVARLALPLGAPDDKPSTAPGKASDKRG
ncbi:MAG TPA: ATP-binding protein [Capillimicrobium sp.]